MKLCLYNGKKKKTTKKSKKTNNSAAANVNKKNGNSSTQSTTPAKPKRNERKKKSNTQLAEDPPVVSALSLPLSLSTQEEELADKFWNFVEPYVSNIVSEDINFLNNMMSNYSKENQMFDIPPLGRLREDIPNLFRAKDDFSQKTSPSKIFHDRDHVFNVINRPEQWCSNVELPENLVERIVGALVDPDLFPEEVRNDSFLFRNIKSDPCEEEQDSYIEPKRMKLFEENVGSVFSDKSNFNDYKSCLNLRSGHGGIQDLQNCDNKTEDQQTDEILEEILKCQQELKLICTENETKLSHLSSKVQKELQHEELKQNIILCENELIKMTQKFHVKKIKKETLSSSSMKINDHLNSIVQKRDDLKSSLDKMCNYTKNTS